MATHTCQCIPFWPKTSFILSLNSCGRYFIAQSMIIITSLPFMLFRRSNLASSWLIVLKMWDLQSSICLVDISRSWRKVSWSSGQLDKMANRTSSTISQSSRHLSHSFWCKCSHLKLRAPTFGSLNEYCRQWKAHSSSLFMCNLYSVFKSAI